MTVSKSFTVSKAKGLDSSNDSRNISTNAHDCRVGMRICAPGHADARPPLFPGRVCRIGVRLESLRSEISAVLGHGRASTVGHGEFLTHRPRGIHAVAGTGPEAMKGFPGRICAHASGLYERISRRRDANERLMRPQELWG